jgi:hypothetical protein
MPEAIQAPPDGPSELSEAQREQRRQEKRTDKPSGCSATCRPDGMRYDEPELSSDPLPVQQLVARAERRPGRQ